MLTCGNDQSKNKFFFNSQRLVPVTGSVPRLLNPDPTKKVPDSEHVHRGAVTKIIVNLRYF
jgi:hypothetical protein